MMRKLTTFTKLSALLLGAMLVLAACGGDDGGEAADGGEVAASFASPEDGATVQSPVAAEFEAEGIEIQEAGAVEEGAGHFHVMVDVGCVTPGETIPSDDSHLHYGDGSTSADIELSPGEHELCLQVADGAHAALDATDTITVTVEE